MVVVRIQVLAAMVRIIVHWLGRGGEVVGREETVGG